MIGDQRVRSQDDPYDDLYVEEVPFHGGPRLVIQGLTSRSAHTARLLLNAIFGPAGTALPARYRAMASQLAHELLDVSHALCTSAGLTRGTAPPDRHGGEVFVPSQERLNNLQDAVIFSPARLTSVLTTNGDALGSLTVSAGHHVLNVNNAADDTLILTPLVRDGSDLIVANPGELAAALRHSLIVLATQYDCRDTLAKAFRDTVADHTSYLLDLAGAVPTASNPWRNDGPLLIRRQFRGKANTLFDVAVLTDDLSDYDPADPYGTWTATNLGEQLQDALDVPADESDKHRRVLRLAATDGFARNTFIGISDQRTDVPFLMVPLDELRVMIELDGHDPLFLWRFATANRRLHESVRVLSWATLDTYAIYRDHDQSFYLSDDAPPTFVNIATASGTALRIEAQDKIDRHQVLALDGDRYVEVLARHSRRTSPIYFVHPRHHMRALLVELPQLSVWVQAESEGSAERVAGLLHDAMDAVAYWLWQLALSDLTQLRDSADVDRLIVTIKPDDAARWNDVLSAASTPNNGHTAAEDPDDTTASWVSARLSAPGKCDVLLHTEHAQQLLAEDNTADRKLVETLAAAVLGPPRSEKERIAAVVDSLAPVGPKRMLRVVRLHDVTLRPVSARPRRVQPAVTATLLDELGAWLTEQGVPSGPVPMDERTDVLNLAVKYYFKRLSETVATLTPNGLMTFLVMQDEALLRDAAFRALNLPSRLACFGANSGLGQELTKEESRHAEAAVASRFLVEYVAATPPSGDRQIDLMLYDELLGLAAELTSRATLSDAIRYGFAQVDLAMLPSGRLGTSRGDRYSAGTQHVAQIETEARVAMALNAGQDTEPDDPKAMGDAKEIPTEQVDTAMREEFGFTLTDLANGFGEMVALADETGVEPAVAAVSSVEEHLSRTLHWDEQKVQDFLSHLVLRPREEFLSIKADAYPWRYNRNHSYIRRPLIEIVSESAEHQLLWGVRRTWTTGRYWTGLVFSGRLRPTSKPMAQLMGSIRQDENKAYERRVAAVLSEAGMPITDRGVKRILSRRLQSADGQDLGDIDAIGIQPANKVVVVAEAKDFELARTPVELANEAKDLLTGPKSAVSKLRRRADWVRSRIPLVLRHYNVTAEAGGWRVLPVVVTSRSLISPLVLTTATPVVWIDDLPAWLTQELRRRQPRRARRG